VFQKDLSTPRLDAARQYWQRVDHHVEMSWLAQRLVDPPTKLVWLLAHKPGPRPPLVIAKDWRTFAGEDVPDEWLDAIARELRSA